MTTQSIGNTKASNTTYKRKMYEVLCGNCYYLGDLEGVAMFLEEQNVAKPLIPYSDEGIHFQCSRTKEILLIYTCDKNRDVKSVQPLTSKELKKVQANLLEIKNHNWQGQGF